MASLMPSHAHSRLLLQLLLQAPQRLRLLADEGVAALAALGRHLQLREEQVGQMLRPGIMDHGGGKAALGRHPQLRGPKGDRGTDRGPGARVC